MSEYLWVIGVATSLGVAIYLGAARFVYQIFINVSAQARNRRHQLFVQTIQEPADEVEVQAELWKSVLRYHPFLAKGGGLINASYFSKTLLELFNGRVSLQAARTQFAMAAKPEWLRSENSGFSISSVLKSERRSTKRGIRHAAKQFLASVDLPEGGLTIGDRIQIVPTALTIDLLNMKPELAVVLYVQDSDVYQRSKEYFRGNWEGRIREYEIWPDNSDLANNVIGRHLNVDEFLPSGAVALAEGLSYFSRTIQPKTA